LTYQVWEVAVMAGKFGWVRDRVRLIVIAGLAGSLVLPLEAGTASAAPVAVRASVAAPAAGTPAAGTLAALPGPARRALAAQKETGLLNSSLTGVSCPTTTDCMAVGSFNAAGLTSTYFTFAEQWNGSAWTLESTVTPPDLGGGALLNAVSCTSPTACMAVGEVMDFHLLGTYFTYQPLAEQWNGVVWKVVPTAPLGNDGAVLNGVTCFLAFKCFAVGSEGTPQVTTKATLAESWDGTSWTVVTTPKAPKSGANALNAVSCATADACEAVGYYDGNSGTSLPLADTWNGVVWKRVNAANPGTTGALTGVSCTAAAACTAVGTSGSNGTAETWNGVVWKAQRLPGPSGATASSLSQVSCTSASACMATGSSTSQSGQSPFTVQWNGVVWKVVPAPDPGVAGALLSVSCAALSVCISVGDDTGLVNLEPLAEGWDGLVWTVLDIVLPLSTTPIR
jgi:hypothetical protein